MVSSALFPFESKELEVMNSFIHYIEAGEGDPIVFLHGMPASSYLWRNIIPSVADQGRCIAPDLIGMGKSGFPDIQYTIFEHIEYIIAFIEKLKLKNITFVMHGWGSIIGFHYAMMHPNNVKALAFMESHVRTVQKNEQLSLPVQEVAAMLKQQENGLGAVKDDNFFIESIFPNAIMKKLSDEEQQRYTEPFAQPQCRQAIVQYLRDWPLGDGNKPVDQIIENYSNALMKSDIPKLMFYTVPGFITTIETVQWAKDHFPNLELVCIEDAMHFPQETSPEIVSEHLSGWLTSVSS